MALYLPTATSTAATATAASAPPLRFLPRLKSPLQSRITKIPLRRTLPRNIFPRLALGWVLVACRKFASRWETLHICNLRRSFRIPSYLFVSRRLVSVLCQGRDQPAASAPTHLIPYPASLMHATPYNTHPRHLFHTAGPIPDQQLRARSCDQQLPYCDFYSSLLHG
jgi:hypothetical protein